MGSLIKSEGGVGSIKTEMGNLKISETCLKSEISCTNQDPSASVCDDHLKKNSDFDTHSLTPVASLNSLVTNLNIPPLKFEDSGDAEIQSPDFSLWESIFSDHPDNDFMICSPVRTSTSMLSPQRSNGYSYAAYPHLVGASPPRFPSPLGPNKGKGMSPLHRVFNSPNNQFMQVEQVENLSLPALESLLDDDTYNKDDDFVVFSPMKIANDCYDGLTAVPELLDCLAMPRFCESEAPAPRDNGGYTQLVSRSSVVAPPLSHQLQQERQQEEQQQRHRQQPPHRLHRQQPPPQNMHNTLMVPMPEPEQVINEY